MNQNEKMFLEELLDLTRIVDAAEDRSILSEKLNRIRCRYEQIASKEALWSILDNMCGDIPDTYFTLLEYLYAAVKDEEVIKKQLQILTNGLQENKTDLFYAIFYKWQIIGRIFLLFDSKSLYIERSNLHHEMLKKMKEFLQVDFSPIEESMRNKDRILVTTTQLLGSKHGPTRNTLDYCYNLQKNLKKEVFLFVAAEMPSTDCSEYESYGLDYGYFNYCDAYEGNFCLEYLGEKIYGYQCRIRKENKEEIVSILQEIYNWKPGLVYNIGSENLVIDICGSFTTEVSIPCAYDFPVTEAGYLILPRNIEARDKEILNYISSRNQKVIESIFVYKLEKPERYFEKKDYKINEDAFVISIVGGRLDREVNEEFLLVLNEILERDSLIYIVFIGTFNNFEEKCHSLCDIDRVKYIGYQSDLRGAFHLADLYLNPPRKGGGTSAVEAMAEGLPVVSLSNCDVGYAAGEEFLCDSLQNIPDLIMKYINDKTFYEKQSNKARVQAENLVDTAGTIDQILHSVLND